MPRPLTQDRIDAFRDDLCRAATRLFAEEGYSGVTMRALAGELGCSPMTPYRYFRNKDEIFEAVRHESFRRFGERCVAAVAGIPDPIERLLELGRAYLTHAREEPHAYRIMFQLEPPPGIDREEPPPETRQAWGVLLSTIADAVAQGRMHGDPVVLAHFCWVSLHGAVTLHVAGRLQNGLTLDELAEPLLARLVQISTARPTAEE